MNKLKPILQSNITLVILAFFTLIYVVISLHIPPSLPFTEGDINLTGKVISVTQDADKIQFTLLTQTKVRCTYYLKDHNNISLPLGSTVQVVGTIKRPSHNTIPNTFDYAAYLETQKIYYVMNVEDIILINTHVSLLYSLKNTLISYISSFRSAPYLRLFILGDKKALANHEYETYQDLGVSHLLAISGMHISLMTTLIFRLLKKRSENFRYGLTLGFLFLYMFLTDFLASVVRSIMFFFFRFLNRKGQFNLSSSQTLIYTILFLLIIKPTFIKDIGFLYSSIISFGILSNASLIKGGYFRKILKISLIAFLYGLPITINLNYEINLFSIINNLFFVPLVSLLIYPLSLITFLIRITDNYFFLLMRIISTISKMFFVFPVTMPKISFGGILLYYLFLIVFFKNLDKKYILLLVLLLLVNKYANVFDPAYYIMYLDVGQGDAIFLKHQDLAILIDTGGQVNYYNQSSYITPNLVTLFKSLGVIDLDYLLLSHGDYDHLGEAFALIDQFKVKKVIFNCGNYNTLEESLQQKLRQADIPFTQCLQALKLKNITLSFLNNNLYTNENDSSNVIYTLINNYQFLFMGDAGHQVEEYLLKNYHLTNIDVLKVGHHGSKTSTSQAFVNQLKPRYAIISVGKNNRYGHPNAEVLHNLQQSHVYRTDLNGSIVLQIYNHKLTLKTYDP